MIWDLEISDKIEDREEYSRQIREYFIPETEKKVKELRAELKEIENKVKPEIIPIENWEIYIKALKETPEYLLSNELKLIKNLKIKLSNYDIYKQKFKCQYCQEVECICYESRRSNAEVPTNIQSSYETRQTGRGDNLETLRGTARDHSDSPRSEEDIKLPF